MNYSRLVGIVAAAAVIPACTSGGRDSTAGGSGTTVLFSDPGIETFPDEGNTHVPVGTVIPYHTDPPTSGNHYPDPQPGGYYTRQVAAGFLVHSLEHGGVVIYVDSSHISSQDRDTLRDLAAQHPGDFAQVVVVPRSDNTYPLILTAWTHRLRLTTYDQDRIDGFLALFLGNGPEHD